MTKQLPRVADAGVLLVALLLLSPEFAPAQSHFAQLHNPVSTQLRFSDLTAATNDPADSVCARYGAGSVVANPPELASSNGKLEVYFHFKSVVDDTGLTRYCYLSTDSSGNPQAEAPTLKVNPGDQLIIHFYNDLAASSSAASSQHMMHMKAMANTSDPGCSATSVSSTSTNLHFHGTNVAPVCHQDEVLHTLVQAQGEFDYDVQIPSNEPPGLYWYHPHPHGFSEAQVIGGASGVIEIQGIENVNGAVANLPERILVLRDQSLPSSEAGASGAPKTDLSINYIPVLYPNYQPATIQTSPGVQEFWRVVNASADTLMDIAVTVNGVEQPLEIVSVDGVPLTNPNGDAITTTQTDYVMPSASRVEFIVRTPAAGQTGQLVTKTWNNGANGDNDPGRPLANIVTNSGSSGTTITSLQPRRLPAQTAATKVARFVAVNAVTPSKQRTFYFSTSSDFSQFYITEQGQTPAPFNMDGPPSVTLQAGTVEEWTIQNQTRMDHSFHIHQIHFQTVAINGSPVNDPTLRDTIDVPHWSGNSSDPYPSVTLLMDFRNPNIVGTFVYHCHILSHEDRGMMAAIQVTAASSATSLSASPANAQFGAGVTLTATVAAASGVGTPSGTVTFYRGSTNLGTAALNSSGVASITTTALPVGTSNVTAAYSGSNSFVGSSASAVSVDIVPAATSTALSTSATSILQGQSVTFTARVASSGGGTPSGTVTFAAGSTTLGSAGLNGSGIATFTTASLPIGSASITASYSGNGDYSSSGSAPLVVVVNTANPIALRFVPVAPCRVADTRNAAGAFGGPELAANSTREFIIPDSSCGIPSNAAAYSLNVTVVPDAVLHYLAVWPSGQEQPGVSTLNSDGRVKANAAIAFAGTNGGVDIFATDATHVILDIDGYFVAANAASGLAYYPVAPCRIADTRNPAGPLGGPYVAAGTNRSFPVLSSTCGLPSNAQAYSLNVTAIPHSVLHYLTTWPTGQAQPNVSTLNAETGAVTANAAIVPAGAGGEISIYTYDDSDVVLDVDGYFAPAGSGGLSLYQTTPCRIIDTRPNAFSTTIGVDVTSSACEPPSAARAYVLNATVVPSDPLNYLTLWPTNINQPLVSTLNAADGAVTSNMAIVPAGIGSIAAFPNGTTNLILDISGYFAP